MKKHLGFRRFSLTSAVLFLFLSCSDDSSNINIDSIDSDMIAATLLADEVVHSMSGRSYTARSVTVLRYKDGKLTFSTNSDEIKGYSEVLEESITATVEAGDYIFWYCGAGLSELAGIEFDASSMRRLVDGPIELKESKMWMLKVPEDVKEEDGLLKYDIVYSFKGGDLIVLDPKIKIADK